MTIPNSINTVHCTISRHECRINQMVNIEEWVTQFPDVLFRGVKHFAVRILGTLDSHEYARCNVLDVFSGLPYSLTSPSGMPLEQLADDLKWGFMFDFFVREAGIYVIQSVWIGLDSEKYYGNPVLLVCLDKHPESEP